MENRVYGYARVSSKEQNADWTIVNKVDRKREKINKDFQIEQEIKGYKQNEDDKNCRNEYTQKQTNRVFRLNNKSNDLFLQA